MYVNLNARLVLNVFIFLSVLLLFYFTFIFTDHMNNTYHSNKRALSRKLITARARNSSYNVWLIFTKVGDRSPLKFKFKTLVRNLLNVTSVPLHFHVFVDENSRRIVDEYVIELSQKLGANVRYNCYDVGEAALLIRDIVDAMTPHFSSKPGTYYSGALFYLSLGLHRIAPESQERAVLLDCDLRFQDDAALLFAEFDKFDPENLFGLAPELTPVYRNVLHKYRTKHNTSFGDYRQPSRKYNDSHPGGYPGYNSGVLLLNLAAIRNSQTYRDVLNRTFVDDVARKYSFKGHLGDQDFYTILGYEHPELFRTLSCRFNRQLCTWWRDHGYRGEVFDRYFRCAEKVVVLHGNCNTKMPDSY